MDAHNGSLARLAHILDTWLAGRGFSSKTLRSIALCEIGLGVAFLAAALMLCSLALTRGAGLWLFWFSLGILAGAVNFVILVVSGQRLVRAAMSEEGGHRQGLLADIMGVMLKLFITAILFSVAVVFLKAPLLALLAGITLTVVIVIAVGLAHAGRV